MDITGPMVWSVLQEDVRFQEHPQAVRLALKPFVEHIPELIGDMFDKQVNLLNLLKAKAAFLEYCLGNGLDEAVIRANPDIAEQPGASLYQRMFMALVDYTTFQFHPLAFLKIHGYSEDDYVIEQLMLNVDLEEAYLARTLTIGQLLLAVPMIFVRHDIKP